MRFTPLMRVYHAEGKTGNPRCVELPGNHFRFSIALFLPGKSTIIQIKEGDG